MQCGNKCFQSEIQHAMHSLFKSSNQHKYNNMHRYLVLRINPKTDPVNPRTWLCRARRGSAISRLGKLVNPASRARQDLSIGQFIKFRHFYNLNPNQFLGKSVNWKFGCTLEHEINQFTLQKQQRHGIINLVRFYGFSPKP